MARKLILLTISLLLLPPAALAEGEAETEAAAGDEPERYPCKTSEQHRAFDFWVGKWNVTSGDRQAGTNEIRLILGDCVLFENWTGARGGTGKSFNFYDAGEDRWRQIWVDDRGGVIEFTGEVRDGAMYYTATTRDPESGEPIRHRLTFTQNEDGSVRQLWEQSGDGGESWQTVFDGHYVRFP